jgi:hypothetical protein
VAQGVGQRLADCSGERGDDIAREHKVRGHLETDGYYALARHRLQRRAQISFFGCRLQLRYP